MPCAQTFSFSLCSFLWLNEKQTQPGQSKLLSQTLQQQIIESLLVNSSFHLHANHEKEDVPL